MSMLATALATALLATMCSSHSFLTDPTPISTVETCRIGGNPGWEAFCGGPCPDYNFRHDMRAENPTAEWQRGSIQTIHYSKNNHVGGFVRLTLVPLDERMRVEAHDALAFHYGCWSTGEYSCNQYQKHRDCGFDLDNLAYTMSFRVPTIHPDGVYVLGWTWYGGGSATGDFGDYYDCSFVRIRGGPITDSYQAVFDAGPERSEQRSCLASVDRLGVCTTEPCHDAAGHKFVVQERIPAPFEHGAPLLYREWMERAQSRAANQVALSDALDFGVTSFSIYDTGSERRLDVNTDEFIDISGLAGITIVPEYFGEVEWVEWVVNGEKQAERYTWPFSIGGEQEGEEHHGVAHNFYDWPYPVLDKRVLVTAIAHSGGRTSFFSKDLYFEKHW